MKSRTPLIVAGVAALVLTAGTMTYVLSSGGPRSTGAPPGPPDSPSPLPPVTGGTAAPPRDDYERAVDAAAQRGIRVWIEADLVKRWLAGEDSFDAAITRVAGLASRPGVAGIKIADELGYQDGLNSASQVQGFLTDTATALNAAAPGRPLLVDLLVPELGCVPGDDGAAAKTCAASQRDKYPQLAMKEVDRYLASHTIDVINLSTYLQSETAYAAWGINRDTAQHAAWQEARRRGWGSLVRLQARKALAHPGGYTASGTAATLTTYIDIPRQNGAAAVDIWTWRQPYKNDIYRLADPGLKPNELWRGLLRQRAAGAVLFTHLSPHSLEAGLGPDLDMIATVFTDLFVAAGTG